MSSRVSGPLVHRGGDAVFVYDAVVGMKHAPTIGLRSERQRSLGRDALERESISSRGVVRSKTVDVDKTVAEGPTDELASFLVRSGVGGDNDRVSNLVHGHVGGVVGILLDSGSVASVIDNRELVVDHINIVGIAAAVEVDVSQPCTDVS